MLVSTLNVGCISSWLEAMGNRDRRLWSRSAVDVRKCPAFGVAINHTAGIVPFARGIFCFSESQYSSFDVV